MLEIRAHPLAVATLRVTDLCNAHCLLCAAHRVDGRVERGDPLPQRRLAATLAAGVPKRLELTGGEPTLVSTLPALIAQAREAGVAEVLLCTNGFALADARRFDALREAGLSHIRLGVQATDEVLCDRLMRRPGAARLQKQALQACATSGMPTEVEIVVHRDNVCALPNTVRDLVALHPGLSGVLLRPFVATPPAAPESLHLPPSDLEGPLREALELLDQAGVAVVPAGAEGWHACGFKAAAHLARLVARRAQGAPVRPDRTMLPACDGCNARDACAGVERSLAAFAGESVVRPVRSEQQQSWLPLRRRTRPDRNRVLDVWEAVPGGGRRARQRIVRILHACNQRCAFCWVDFAGPTMTLAEVLEATVDARRPDGTMPAIALTGGEPTLHPDLLAIVEGVRALGPMEIELQTNAVRCADGDLATRLATAGLDTAVVSLHAADAASSDAITHAPGTWARTLAGIDKLLAAGVRVTLNYVLTTTQAQHFPAFVETIAARFPPGAVRLTLSVAGQIGEGALDPSSLPRWSEVAPAAAAGLERARALGLEINGNTGECNLPPCVLGPALSAMAPASLLRFGAGDGSTVATGSVKGPDCRRCSWDRYCPGVRAEYAAAHGFDEFRPLREAPPAPVEVDRVSRPQRAPVIAAMSAHRERPRSRSLRPRT